MVKISKVSLMHSSKLEKGGRMVLSPAHPPPPPPPLSLSLSLSLYPCGNRPVCGMLVSSGKYIKEDNSFRFSVQVTPNSPNKYQSQTWDWGGGGGGRGNSCTFPSKKRFEKKRREKRRSIKEKEKDGVKQNT